MLQKAFAQSRWIIMLLAVLMAMAGLRGHGASDSDIEHHRMLAILASLGGIICHSEAGGEPESPAPDRRNGSECILCLLCQTQPPLAALGVPIRLVGLTPARRSVEKGFFPSAVRTPPVAAHTIAQPRGPPSLI